VAIESPDKAVAFLSRRPSTPPDRPRRGTRRPKR
jgi:hypothetical protein